MMIPKSRFDKGATKEDNGIDKLDWRKKDTILEWAARYEIQNDERLRQSLQDMRRMGGTLGMKTFYDNIMNRVNIYNQIIEHIIDQRVRKMVSNIMLYILIVNFLIIYLYK